MLHNPTLYVTHHDRALHLRLHPIAQTLGANLISHLQGHEFLRSFRPTGNDCVVTDFHLLDMTGLELQRAIRSQDSATVVLFLSDAPAVPDVVKAIQAGANDVLLRHWPDAKLRDSISGAFEDAARRNQIDQAHDEQQQRFMDLTPKERQVLDMMLGGTPNKVIAKRLAISLRTVEVRRQQIFRKTQTRSVAELVRVAIQSAAV